MYMSIMRGKSGPGISPDVSPASIVNRVGTGLRVNEVLMLDFDNQTYDTTAGITGCLGNGVYPANPTPSSGSAIGYHTYPMVLVTGAPNGKASGQFVDGIVQGFGTSIQLQNGTPIATTICGVGSSQSGVGTLLLTNATTATLRLLMLNRQPHLSAVAATEQNIFGYFCGNSTR